MYVSQTQQAIQLIELGALLSDSTKLKGVIQTDIDSLAKSEMREAEKYYNNSNDILLKDFRVFHVNGEARRNENAPNNTIPHAFFNYLVDQKVEYIAGNQVKFSVNGADEGADNEATEMQARIDDNVGIYIQTSIADWLQGASTKGWEALYVFVNKQGKFDYTVINALGLIPELDDLTGEVLSMVRYYYVDYQDETTGEMSKRIKAEIYDSEQVYFYIEQRDDKTKATEIGNFVPDPNEDPNPRPHLQIYFEEGDGNKARGWGKVPFIILKNNTKKVNDLRRIKKLIDLYDKLVSKTANTLEDIQEAVMVLRGYEGTNLAEFYENLKVFKVITVGEEGGAEALQMNVPTEALNQLLDRIEMNIYKFGRGVNFEDKNFSGDQSGIALKYKFAGLDLKANQAIAQLKYSLRDFAWFLLTYLNIFDSNISTDNLEEIDFVVNKSLIINETEIITNLNNSRDIMSKRLMMQKHPYINDVERNVAEMEEEETPVNFDDVEAEPPAIQEE